MATPRDLETSVTLPARSQASIVDTGSSLTVNIPTVEQHQSIIPNRSQNDAADVEAARDSRADCGLKGYFGLASLQNNDEVYRIGWTSQRAAGIVRLRRQARIDTLEREYFIAEQSGDLQRVDEIYQELSQEVFRHYQFSYLERQVNSFGRPSKALLRVYASEATQKLGGSIGYLSDDPQHSMNLHDFDKLDLWVRWLLELETVQFIFTWLKTHVVRGEDSGYIFFKSETLIVMKMCVVLFATLTLFCIPVMILALEIISSKVAVSIFYAAIVIVSCAVSTLIFEPHIAMTITLGVGALLGTVIGH